MLFSAYLMMSVGLANRLEGFIAMSDQLILVYSSSSSVFEFILSVDYL